MQLWYGALAFPINQSYIAMETEVKWNAGGQPFAQRRVYHIKVKLSVNGQADTTAQMVAVAAGLAIPYQNLVLFQDTGAPSATLLTNTGSITGVRITKGPDYPEDQGPEYATVRTLTFSAEATYPLAGSNALLLDYHESMSYDGGGPQYIFKPALNTPPQVQLVYPLIPFHVIQQGRAVGYRGYPNFTPPKFPFALIKPAEATRDSPKRMGFGYQEYPISWKYEFMSNTPLIGLPTIWVV